MPSIDYDYFLRGNPSDVLYQCIIITLKQGDGYVNFAAVANNGKGIKAMYNGALMDFNYVPLEIKRFKSDDSLEQTFEVSVGDLGVEFGDLIRMQTAVEPAPIDNAPYIYANQLYTPRVVYLEYLSSDLNTPFAQIENLQLTEYKFVDKGGIFKVSNTNTNKTTTGVLYTLNDFAGLRGFY